MAVADHLLRDLAPVPARAWTEIDDEARTRLVPLLAARRIVDWVGTGGWKHDALGLGRTTALDGPPAGVVEVQVEVRQRRVLPLAEVRVPFVVSLGEIADIQRGARDLDLDDVARAALVAAEVENTAVFHGWPAAGIVGMTGASAHEPIPLGAGVDDYPRAIARAADVLRGSGVDGPYALAISPEGHRAIMETAEHGGELLVDHLGRILGGGPILRSPGVGGAVVVSTRGGDFSLDVGQDLSVGYHHHDGEFVYLYLEESFTFLVVEPDAAIALV